MANIWLRSTDGNDGNAGTQKEAPKLTLQAAMTAAGAGGSVYVSNLHAESGAAATLSSAGTPASPTVVVCVPDWGADTGTTAPTSRSTGATFTTSVEVLVSGNTYYYGLSIASSSTNGTSIRFGNTGSSCWAYMEACELKLTGNSATPSIAIGRGGSTLVFVHWHNTVCNFAHVGQDIVVNGRFRWTGTLSAVTGTIPDVLFTLAASSSSGIAVVEGVDLSALGSGKAWVNAASTTGEILFVSCKAGSSVVFTSGTHPGQAGVIVTVVNCDSADTQNRFFRLDYAGSEIQETTIVRAGGATEWGASSGRKIAASANAQQAYPYRSLPMQFANNSLSALTVTILILTDNVTLTDAEAWLEVEYLGTSGFPLGVFASDRVADPIFGTPANQTTDSSSSWTTTGLGTPVKQSLSVTFTPAEKGIVRARVCIAKASTTVYYDPKALTTSARQYQSTAGYVNEGGPGAQPNIFDSAIIRAVHP